MVVMTFDEFDALEEKVKNMPEDLEMQENFSVQDFERLFITFVNPGLQTGHASLAIPFLLYLKAKIDESDIAEFRETSKNIDTILRKYLELTEE